MKRQGYKFAVAWISMNDEAECLDATEVQGFTTTILVADLFGKHESDVAHDIVRYRTKFISRK